jgi:hypothetical protein
VARELDRIIAVRGRPKTIVPDNGTELTLTAILAWSVEKGDEFLVAMASHALPDQRAVEDIESREQRGRAMPDIIMGHRPSPVLLYRQARLGAVERLDLRLLVDRQRQAVGRRVEIQSDHVAQFGSKGRILGQFEAPNPVWLQAVRRPDPLHRAQRYAAGRGIARPVQCVGSPGGSVRVSATTRSTSAGGKPGFLVFSRNRPATPSRMNRSCQRHTQGFDQRLALAAAWASPVWLGLVIDLVAHRHSGEATIPAGQMNEPITSHDPGSAFRRTGLLSYPNGTPT